MVSDEVKGIIYMAVNETKPLSPVEIHDKIKSKCDVTLQEVSGQIGVVVCTSMQLDSTGFAHHRLPHELRDS